MLVSLTIDKTLDNKKYLPYPLDTADIKNKWNFTSHHNLSKPETVRNGNGYY